VKSFLERSGQEALPVILVDGDIALAGRYPNRAGLASRTRPKRSRAHAAAVVPAAERSK